MILITIKENNSRKEKKVKHGSVIIVIKETCWRKWHLVKI